MMSDDIIESVTAEIEAIIQEEINSKNLVSAVDENLITCESVNLTLKDEQVQKLDICEGIAEFDSEIKQHGTLITTEKKLTAENFDISVVDQKTNENTKDKDLSLESKEEISNLNKIIFTESAPETAEIFVEQINEFSAQVTVVKNGDQLLLDQDDNKKIRSSSHETVSISEIEDTISTMPLAEETIILSDAPIDENDGPRAKHFKQALRKALNNTIKSCSGEKLESCFPFNLKSHQLVHINFTIFKALQSVIEGIQGPFDDFLRSENLVNKLNKVDDFTRSRIPGSSDGSEAEIIASLTPQNLVDRKLYSTKLTTLDQLEKFAQKLELENSKLNSELNSRQNEFIERVDRLKSSQQLLDAALDQISTISMDDFEILVDKMNHQYQPSALKMHY